jgi:Ca2+-binding EF-hand superfamily protein
MDAVEDFVRESIFGTWGSLKRAFTVCDTNGDGQISPSEFKLALKDVFGLNLTPLEVVALLARFDADRDGRISFAEFKDFLENGLNEYETQVDNNIIVQAFRNLKRIIEQKWCSMRDAFLALDSNRSGFVSRDEFTELLKQFGLNLSPAQMKVLVAQFDVNKDGKVSHQEFMTVMAKH